MLVVFGSISLAISEFASTLLVMSVSAFAIWQCIVTIKNIVVNATTAEDECSDGIVRDVAAVVVVVLVVDVDVDDVVVVLGDDDDEDDVVRQWPFAMPLFVSPFVILSQCLSMMVLGLVLLAVL